MLYNADKIKGWLFMMKCNIKYIYRVYAQLNKIKKLKTKSKKKKQTLF